MAAASIDDFKRRKDSGTLGTLNRILIFTIILAGGILLMTIFLPQLSEQERLRNELEALDGKIAAERDLNNQYRREIDWLTHDLEYLEVMARDRLDQMKEGEVIFRIEVSNPEPELSIPIP